MIAHGPLIVERTSVIEPFPHLTQLPVKQEPQEQQFPRVCIRNSASLQSLASWSPPKISPKEHNKKIKIENILLQTFHTKR